MKKNIAPDIAQWIIDRDYSKKSQQMLVEQAWQPTENNY